MGIFNSIGSVFSDLGTEIEKFTNELRISREISEGTMEKVNATEFAEVVKNEILKDSLTCKDCRGLSVPVQDTFNKYLCLKCGCRFTNSRHRFNQTAPEFFYDPKTDTSVREVDPDHKFINITANDYSRAVKKIIEENF